MQLHERLSLAETAYERAIARACDRSTPASWARLLRAARNLHCARSELERGANDRMPAAAPRRQTKGATACDEAELHPAAAPSRFAALLTECERARALVAESRRLVREARSLCAALYDLRAAWRNPLPVSP